MRLPASQRVPTANDRWVSNFDQFFVGLSITVFELDGGRRFATPMDLLWQINYGKMLSGLMVTTFLILLDASVVVVASMVMFPLIELAFKKKAKPAPRPAQVETWQHDGLTAHAQLSGRPLSLTSDFLRPDAGFA
jgi:hypothetical protein